jgi:uncharacterized protein with PIN domain
MSDGLPRFLVDENVASLARRLRWLGYDAVHEPALDDPELVARSEAEQRVLLTRDRGILLRRQIVSGRVQALWIRSDDPWLQLTQVVQSLGLDPASYACTRCVRCNVRLHPISREAAEAHVPPYISATQAQFTFCPQCGRYFWRGTHWDRMRASIEKHLDSSPEAHDAAVASTPSDRALPDQMAQKHASGTDWLADRM